MNMTEKIRKACLTLETIAGDSKALKAGMAFLKNGSSYSNHDFDILQSLTREIAAWEKFEASRNN